MSAPWTGGSDPGSDRPSVDGDYTVPAAIGPPRISFPFEHDSQKSSAPEIFFYDPATGMYTFQAPDASQANLRTEAFFIEQDFEMAADYFSGLALNTAYDHVNYAPDYAGTLALSEAILINESAAQEEREGLVKWTRTYCRMPGLSTNGSFSRNEYEQVSFTFPGIAPGTTWQPDGSASAATQAAISAIAGSITDGRPPVTYAFMARVQYDFFLSTSLNTNTDDPNDISYVFPEFKVYGDEIWINPEAVMDSTFLAAGSAKDNSGGTDSLSFSNTSPPATDDTGTGEKGYTTAVHGGWEIVVRGSDIKPWRGNIFVRTTWWAVAR